MDDECIYLNKFKTAERRTFYPFNRADSVALISFKTDHDYYSQHFMSVNYDLIIRDSVFEHEVLDSNNIDLLTDMKNKVVIV